MEVTVSFTPRPLYPQGKSPRYPLARRPSGTQSQSRHGVEEKNSQPRWESNPDYPIVQPVASRCTDWAIATPSVPRYYNKGSVIADNLQKTHINKTDVFVCAQNINLFQCTLFLYFLLFRIPPTLPRERKGLQNIRINHATSRKWETQ
jgi:hypothetical protein